MKGSIFVSTDAQWMQHALDLARVAFKAGEVPIGALIVKNDEVLAEAYNVRQGSKNPLDHAEIRALKEAAEKIGDWRLTGCTLYVTLEPCPMCLGALFQARIDRLVFGCADPKRKENEIFPTLLSQPSVLNFNNHNLAVTSGVLAENCSQILKDFFKMNREKTHDEKSEISEIIVSSQGGSCGFPDEF